MTLRDRARGPPNLLAPPKGVAVENLRGRVNLVQRSLTGSTFAPAGHLKNTALLGGDYCYLGQCFLVCLGGTDSVNVANCINLRDFADIDFLSRDLIHFEMALGQWSPICVTTLARDDPFYKVIIL